MAGNLKTNMVSSSVLLSQGDVPIKLLRVQMSSQYEQQYDNQAQIIFIITVLMQDRISMVCDAVGGRLDFK